MSTAKPALRPTARILVFDDESCVDQKAGLSLDEISGVVLQEYGKLSTSASSSYLNHRFELQSPLGTWVLAADTEAERSRWLDEIQSLGVGLKDKRPSAQQWDHQGVLETRLAIASLGWKSRFIRVRGYEFIVFREQSSQVVKEIVRRPRQHITVSNRIRPHLIKPFACRLIFGARRLSCSRLKSLEETFAFVCTIWTAIASSIGPQTRKR